MYLAVTSYVGYLFNGETDQQGRRKTIKDGQRDTQRDRQTNRRTDGRTDGRMDGQTDRQTVVRTCMCLGMD